MKTTTPYTDVDALQARLAARLVAGLGESATALSPDIGERLRVAREQAVMHARQARQTAPARAAAVLGTAHGAGLLGLPAQWWQGLASAMPLAVLLFGLALIDHWNVREQVVAAADIDAVLLADDLPPVAYSDPGFAEFLKTTAP